MKPWAASGTTISELAVHKSAAHSRLTRSSLRHSTRVTLSPSPILTPSSAGSLSAPLLRPCCLHLRPIPLDRCNAFTENVRRFHRVHSTFRCIANEPPRAAIFFSTQHRRLFAQSEVRGIREIEGSTTRRNYNPPRRYRILQAAGNCECF